VIRGLELRVCGECGDPDANLIHKPHPIIIPPLNRAADREQLRAEDLRLRSSTRPCFWRPFPGAARRELDAECRDPGLESLTRTSIALELFSCDLELRAALDDERLASGGARAWVVSVVIIIPLLQSLGFYHFFLYVQSGVNTVWIRRFSKTLLILNIILNTL